MFCPSCGAENRQGAKFCTKCGSALPIPASRGLKKKRAVYVVIAGVIAVCLIGLVAAAVYLLPRVIPDDGKASRLWASPTAKVGSAITHEPMSAPATATRAPTKSVEELQEPKSFSAPPTPRIVRPPTEKPAPLPTATPDARDSGTTTVGVWEIALAGSTPLADYEGRLPAEGHRFHQIELLVVNVAKVPVHFGEGTLHVEARWKDYTYYALSQDTVSGYLPPGWPTSVKVVFDLPTIADPVRFYVTQPGEDIVLNDLGSALAYDPPLTRRLGSEFVVLERLSVTPTSLRPLDPSGVENSSVLLLDCTVANLYGQDIMIERQRLRFQLFSDSHVVPISAWADADYPKWLEGGEASKPLAPGFTREGSFWLDTRLSPAPNGPMLLLVMYGGPYMDFTYKVSQWAIYEVGDAAVSMLERPLR